MLGDETREIIIRHFEALGFWKPHWQHSAVIVAGSCARGIMDEFTDVDVIVYVPESSFDPLYAAYRSAADEARIEVMNSAAFKYGEFPFVLVAGVRGHYRVFVFEEAERQIARHDDVAMWIHQSSLVLHDPSGRYSVMQEAASAYPEDVWRERVRFHYLEAVWAAGAASNPLRRNDLPAVTLTMTACVGHVLRLCCLRTRCRFRTTSGCTRRHFGHRLGVSSDHSSRSSSRSFGSRC